MLKELARQGCVELSAVVGADQKGSGKNIGDKRHKSAQVRSPGAVSSSGRNRKEYRITETGFEKLREWLAAPPEKELTRFEMLVKVYFGHLVPKDAILSFIESFGADHQTDLDALRKFREELRAVIGVCENHPFILATIEMGIKVNEAYTRWAAETCASCGKCAMHCPMSLDVQGMVKAGNMRNDECVLCGECVGAPF